MSSSAPGVHAHSGTIGAAIVIVPIAAVIAALVLGVAYAYIDVYSPVAGYVSLLFVAGFVFALGWTVSKIGYFTRCRSATFLFVTGLAAGFLGLYTSWAAFEYAVLQRSAEAFDGSLLGIFLSPRNVWEIAKSINASGWYTIRSFTPSGMVLWGIEAVAITAGTALIAATAISEEVFCERCERWTSRSVGKARLALPDNASRLSELAPDNLAPLDRLAPVSELQNPHLRIDSWECRSCQDGRALQVKLQKIELDDKGKPEEKTEDIAPIFTVSTSAFERVMELAKRIPREQPVTSEVE